MRGRNEDELGMLGSRLDPQFRTSFGKKGGGAIRGKIQILGQDRKRPVQLKVHKKTVIGPIRIGGVSSGGGGSKIGDSFDEDKNSFGVY